MGDIIIRDIFKSYGEKAVLKGVSAEIKHGEKVFVSAPSGAGKTTLFRIIMGLEKPDSGSVSGLENAAISVVFQEERLIENMTAEQNIRLVTPHIKPEQAAFAMAEIGLSGCENQKVSELSGGMRRRVSVLRAVLNGGGILLLDEPFKGLDSDTKQLTAEFIKSKTAEKTLVLITHDASEAAALGCKKEIKI